MALHSKGRLFSNTSHYIHKYRSLLFVNNTKHSCFPFPMPPCDLQLNYCFHLFLYYLTSNHFAKSSFLLFPVIWCIRFLLLCNQLLQTKTMHIYLVIFIWSMHIYVVRSLVAGSSSQGLRRTQSRCQLGCIHVWKLDWGKICSQANLDCC